MRRFLALAILLAACSNASDEPVSTTTPVSLPSTSSTSAGTSSTSATSTSTSAATDTTTTTTTVPPAPLTGLALEDVVRVEAPIETVAVDGALYVASKEGRVWLMDGEPQVVLDITGPVLNRGEQGLLGAAIHPDFPTDRRLFVYYIDQRSTSTLASYVLASDGRSVVDNSVRILLTEPQPATNHNGGKLAFGPDGYLYLALGDGGRSNDAFGNGQNSDTLLGSILRLDVSDPDGYSIPSDNPFRGEGADEVWAIGLRNPWRFTFDGTTMYIADVGQDAYEEIDVVPVVPAGYNFGWPITEGLHCFRPSAGCDVDGLTLPILEVAHGDAGTCSITGGVVYRGSSIPELSGHYLYSDYCGGYLRSLAVVDGVATEVIDWTESTGPLGQVVAFGTDTEGEVLVMTVDGDVRRLVPVRS